MESGCVELIEDKRADVEKLQPTTLGGIASFYYLRHTTVRMFKDFLVEE